MTAQVVTFVGRVDTTQGTNRDVLAAIVDNLTAVGGALDNAKVHLFTNTPTINPNLVLADYTAPDWTGYGSQSVTWDTVHRHSGAFGEENVGSLCRFTMGADGTADPTGALLTNEDTDVVYGAVMFDEPIPYAEGVQVDIIPRLLLEQV